MLHIYIFNYRPAYQTFLLGYIGNRLILRDYGTAGLGSPQELGIKETLYLLSILLVRGVRVKQNFNYEQNEYNP